MSTTAPQLDGHLPVVPMEPVDPVTVAMDVSQDEWDAFVERHPLGTADHLWHWRDVFAGVFGHECIYLAARRAGALVGVLPLVRFRSRLFGRFLVSLPFLNYGGLLASDDESAGALVDRAARAAREFGASHVELRHRSRQRSDLPHRQHKVSMRLPLPGSANELWKRIDRKVRNQVRKAQKEGLTGSEGGGALVDQFYQVFAVNMRDLGTPVYTRRLFEETLRLFPDRARVHLVHHEGRPVAGAVTMSFRGTVLVPWASSVREYRHLSPNMLLYWNMLESAATGGARLFDFGRSSPGGGTFQFKQQWGALAEPQSWEYILLGGSSIPDQGPSNSKFDFAIETWKRLPLWIANAAGPHIVRNIP